MYQRSSVVRLTPAALVLATLLASSASAARQGRPGTPVPREALGPGVVESFDAVRARHAAEAALTWVDPKSRNGEPGEWQVPKARLAIAAHSGTKYVFNRWGETRLGIGFGQVVDVSGAWIARHGTRGLETTGLAAVGYRNGVAVAQTDWFEEIGDEPAWFAIGLTGVDRIELLARPVHGGAGWYGLDDLTYVVAGPGEAREPSEPSENRELVVDFEDLPHRTRLGGSDYAGLSWELGSGPAVELEGERMPPAHGGGVAAAAPKDEARPSPDLGTRNAYGPRPPRLVDEIAGPVNGDAGTLGVPDTNGAVGPNHYVAAPNGNLSIYSRSTGARLSSVSQTSFWGVGGTLGDPRIVYDSHHDRFVMLASNWTDRIYLAYSSTSDPTGAWFKTSIFTPVGPDAGTWPDYPTLGLDANGIYIGVFQVFQSMTIYAIDKAPMLAPDPSLGAVSAWRQLPMEGAVQPCVTFGDSGGVYLVSDRTSSSLRLRQITGSLAEPVLHERGSIAVPTYTTPPDVPQAGTSVNIDPGSTRPMNAVYRNGSVWTTHTVRVGTRAGVRWYRIDPVTVTAAEIGTVADTERGYFMPSLAVNERGDLFVGFSGCGPTEFVGSWGTGRRVNDPSGRVATPRLLRAGEAPYTFVSGGGSSRWGDYSTSGIDPLDDRTFWTIQEFAGAANVWKTQISALRYVGATGQAPAPKRTETLGE